MPVHVLRAKSKQLTRADLPQIEGAEIGRTYLRVLPGTSLEQVHAIARYVSDVNKGSEWWLADLANIVEQYGDDSAVF